MAEPTGPYLRPLGQPRSLRERRGERRVERAEARYFKRLRRGHTKVLAWELRQLEAQAMDALAHALKKTGARRG